MAKINFNSQFIQFVWLSTTKVMAIRQEDITSPSNLNRYRLYMSTDSGATFSEISGASIDVAMVTSFRVRELSAIIADSSQNIYLVSANKNTNIILVKWAKGVGDTWAATSNTITAEGTPVDRSMRVVIDTYSKIHIAHTYQNGFGSNGVTYTAALNNLASWTAANPGFPLSTASYTISRTVALGIRNGQAHLIWSEANPVGNSHRLRWSIYTGSSWSSASSTSDSFLDGAGANKVLMQMDAVSIAGNKLLLAYSGIARPYTPNWETTPNIDQYIKYSVFDGTSWVAQATVHDNATDSVDRLYEGPFLSSDGTNAMIGYVTQDSGGSTWTVRSRRYADSTLEAEVAYTTGIVDHLYIGVNDNDNMVYGPKGAKVYGEGFMFYMEKTYSDPDAFQLQTIANPYAPTQPSLLTVDGVLWYEGCGDDVTPRLGWDFTDVNVGDSQSAYQVIIYDAGFVQILDTGKVTSTDNFYDVLVGLGMVMGDTYYFKVRVWDQTDLPSIYSETRGFPLLNDPTATITNPSAAEVFTTDTPILTWTYAQAQSVSQTKYEIRIINTVTSEEVYYYMDDGAYWDTFSHAMPGNYLENGGSYELQLRVKAAQWSTIYSQNFTVVFVAPPAPTVTANPQSDSSVDVDIELNAAFDDGWSLESLRIYRRLASGTDWTPLDTAYAINQKLINSMDSITGITTGGVAITPTLSTNTRQGLNSVNLGVTGVGYNAYSFDPDLGNWSDQDMLEFWMYAADPSDFDYIHLSIGNDALNYWTMDIDNTTFTAGVWNCITVDPTTLAVGFGSPNKTSLNLVSLRIEGAVGAIPIGDIKIDRMRFYKKNYTYTDYNTQNGKSYVYGVSAYNNEQVLESIKAVSAAVEITFGETLVNAYLIPVGAEDQMVKAWMDGAREPSITDKTDVTYYQPRGAVSPIAFVNGMQQYKEGGIELRFFDEIFGGLGLSGAQALDAIKNYKPILLKTWWGDNYYISIDGDITKTRKAGIGWYSTFTFTEIGL